MHARDWINDKGRYMRQVYASDLRRILKRPKGVCTWCAGPLPEKRRSWCSGDCVEEFRSRCDVSHIRYLVKHRDNGVCALCGLDTVALMGRIVTGFELAKERRRWHSWKRFGRLKKAYCAHTYSAWEADHIVPVSEGGGCCGLDGYRTLCRKCHKGESAKLAARLAAAKRPIDRQEVLQLTD